MASSSSANDNPKPSDRRVLRTLKNLNEALLSLIEKYDLAEINVATIAEEAGVSRSTFYDHYQNVHQLAEVACTILIDELVESLPTPDSDTVEQRGPQSLQAFFENLKDHAGLYSNLLGPQGSALVSDHIRRRITAAVRTGIENSSGAWPRDTRPAPRVDDQVAAAFTGGALIGVALDWLHSGFPCMPEEIAAMTWKLMSTQGNGAGA
ncbi:MULTISPECIES: TetR/AcrR family transcriptional regulator C-terminal domain-containing protein [unclassified Arthrobacter]|uniref:TetR/AcrR family transcriptional regulator n=1 Tax=unclassified Arthrobacter TaxID=235627 RepID=UPI002883303F|nr:MULTISPECIES: TetR/AcrR family transcriptional regulator C-terminal domain-containing protein [unclassified Arthrobacter]